MKKTICLIGMLLCLCVIGSAFAIAYFNADNETGTITADSYLRLTLNTSTQTELVLEEDIPSYYTIEAAIDRSAGAESVTANGRLTISLADTTADSADDIKISVFTNSNCTTPLQINETNVVQVGAGEIVISGIQATTNYYLTVEINGTGHTAAELAGIAGTMTISFVRVLD